MTPMSDKPIDPPGIVSVDRRIMRDAMYVDAVMRQVYAATSWDNRIAEIEQAVWDVIERMRAETSDSQMKYRMKCDEVTKAQAQPTLLEPAAEPVQVGLL